MRILSLSPLLLAACFDLSADTTPSPCEQMVETLCAQACACADVECYHFVEGWSAAYTSEAACRSEERRLWCDDSGFSMDFAACEAALGDAACGDDYGQAGLELPEACGDMVDY